MNSFINHKLASIIEVAESNITSIDLNSTFDAVIIKTNFHKEDIGKNTILKGNSSYLNRTKSLIDTCCTLIKDGGIIFIYGLPNYLSFLGEYLSDIKNGEYSFLFKYWIACEFLSKESSKSLPHAHVGLLMYLKSKSKIIPTPFDINTKYVRIPYSKCPACGNNTKDWGGKKHMIIPLGSAISDVWSFIDIPIEESPSIPSELVERILALFSENKHVLLVNQDKVKPNLKEYKGKRCSLRLQ